MRALHAIASLALVASLAPSTGCYFGRSPQAKKGGYVANGLLVATGAALLVSAFLDDSECESVGCAFGSAGDAYFGYLLGGVGAVGIGINLIVPTKVAAPDPSSPVPPTATAAYTVTAPGLAPATVQMR
ncbi:MAG: hypothetical protein SFX73_00535 [Kofleriaceae bacterium]|nr:hypothetical protein [Kofleriaceae bacterium]